MRLVVTGLLTFLPGRIMYRVVFGPEGATPEKLALFIGTIVVLAVASLLVLRWRRSAAGTSFIAAH